MSAERSPRHLDRLLAELPQVASTAAREAGVKARCHAVLGGRSSWRKAPRGGVWKRRVLPIAASAFCVVYFTALILVAL
jgi:hypothetical protein